MHHSLSAKAVCILMHAFIGTGLGYGNANYSGFLFFRINQFQSLYTLLLGYLVGFQSNV